MRYDASEDQQLLRDTTRRFLDDHRTLEDLRTRMEDPQGWDPAVWQQGAALGWVSLFVPEEAGGMAEAAEGAVDAAILAEELGRVVYAGPFLPTNVVAFALSQSGTDAQRKEVLAPVVAGERVATWCFAGPGTADGTLPAGVSARAERGRIQLEGTSGFVQDAHVADHLLVTARTSGGLSQFLLPRRTAGVTIESCDALDLGRRLATVRFEGVSLESAHVVGELDGAAAGVERQLQLAVLLQCAETVGVIDRALESTIEYAKERVAFGRPIGSYQALKHRLADHVTTLEGAKALTDHAARSVEDQSPDAALSVSLAKSHVGRSASEIARDCIQIHGGIGVTWEHDLHLYARRAISNEALWGTPAAHHERLCRIAGLPEGAAA